MASRNRIHKSSVTRRRGPTQPHNDKAETGHVRHEAKVSPKRNARRNLDLDTDKNYGSGRKTKQKAEKWGAEAGKNTRFQQTGMEDDYTDPRPHNNYDDSDVTYPPAHRW